MALIKKYVHVPGTPTTTLPAASSDQLCHAVIKTRTIKPMKASKCSNTYQMHEQRGSFQGIDTCNVTSIGNFAHNSHLLRRSELLSIANRPDIVSLLSDLRKQKKISKVFEESLIQLAKTKQLSREKLASYLNGSTFVSLDDAMKMQELLTDSDNRRIRITKVNENEENTIGKLSLWLLLCLFLRCFQFLIYVFIIFESILFPKLDNPYF